VPETGDVGTAVNARHIPDRDIDCAQSKDRGGKKKFEVAERIEVPEVAAP
jgi:hypothetical protein